MRTLSILGCGWLGKAVATKFIKQGWQVKGATTRRENFLHLEELKILPFIVSLDPHPTGDNLDEFFGADVLLVAIPPKRKSGQTDRYLEQVNALGTYLSSTSVSRVIFISSTSVYADLNREVYEDDADHDAYLFKAEQSLQNYSSFKTTVLRFGGLVGPDRHPGRFLSGKTDVAGPDAPVNMIHQQDCVEIIYAIAEAGVFGETFNACADLHPAKQLFYAKASEALELSPPVFNRQPSSFKQINSDKLKNRLNYQFIFPDPLDML